MIRGTICSVNTSPGKGTVKTPVPRAVITATGLASDAHAGDWHRQVSLLASERIAEFGATAKRTFAPGEFAENLTTAGLDLLALPLGTRLAAGTALLELTQHGKKCHGGGCAIMQAVGSCVMPKDGVFAKVITPGVIAPGDALVADAGELPCAVITCSDRASCGEYEDRSGPALVARLQAFCDRSARTLACTSAVVPDETSAIAGAVRSALAGGARLVFTTGGTGIGPRDVTPEAVRPLLDREIPGLMERIRALHAARLPSALLSRSLAGTAGSALVFCLPGSPKAVDEHCDEIWRVLEHALLMLAGRDAH